MIKILLFTNLKEKFGKDSIDWQGSGLTVAELKEQLINEFQVADELQAVMTAVNEEFVDATYKLNEGDTVAFIPPVSGG
ncbi:molybdopterin converting factor subunit 1 [Bacillus massiliigorillae]|uniref:molybdopterin converting factor subunit 1 n=1 Tax=Bacillus massiliigorillae TaxID=1243664 RepID=UPI00039A14E6|nr:molybdopterin converting factor subunit 1 [Bacillus massiliigorillae]